MSSTLDESYSHIKNGDHEIILSISDAPVHIGEGSDLGDSFENLDIYAESIVISGRVKAKHLNIFAHSVKVLRTPQLDVSGENGANKPSKPQGDGGSGDDGFDSGTINMYVENFTVELLDIKFNARGGDGGAGQNTSDGKGGDGGASGDGGMVCFYYTNKLRKIRPKVDAIFEIKGNDPEYLLYAKKNAFEDIRLDLLEIFNQSKRLESQTDMIESIKDTKDSDEFDQKLDIVDKLLWAESNNIHNDILPHISISEGNYGVYGGGTKENGHNGNSGKSGKYDVQEFSFDNMKDIPFAFANPDQCLMLLQRAQILYFAQDKGSIEKSCIILQKLIDRLGFTTYTDKSGPLYKAYQNNRYIAPYSMDVINSIYGIAKALLAQIISGVDYFGNDETYTPLASYTFYDEQTERLLDVFDTIEQTYTNYHIALKEQQDVTDMVKDARDNADSMISQAQGNINQLEEYLERDANSISAYTPIIKSKIENIHKSILALETEIKSHFDFNFGNFFDSLTMAVFAPNKYMGALQAAQLGYHGLTEFTDDFGVGIKKEYLINSISDVDATVDALIEGFESRDDGTLEVDDPGASKLIVQKEKLEELLSGIRRKLKGETFDAFRASFDDCINTVIERNNVVFRYNSQIVLLVKYQQQKKQYETKKIQLGQVLLKKSDFNLPLVSSYMSQLYLDARTQMLEILYRTQKSFRFWSLSDDNAITDELKGNPLSNITYAVAKTIHGKLIKNFSVAVENRGQTAQTFTAHDFDKNTTFCLDKGSVELLKKFKSITFNIPPVYSNTEEYPFKGWADIRLTRIRVWLKGAKTKDNMLQVRINRYKQETIVNKYSKSFTFSHAQPVYSFRYKIFPRIIIEDVDIGDKMEETYAMLGPFTTWEISVENYNTELDLSGLTEVKVEFSGTNYAF